MRRNALIPSLLFGLLATLCACRERYFDLAGLGTVGLLQRCCTIPDRIRTPLLLIHGREDVSSPVQEAEKMFVGLRRLGRTAQLAVYEDEGHVITDWAPAHAVDAADRVLDFLRRHTGRGAKASAQR